MLCSSDAEGVDCYLSILPETICDVVGLAPDTQQCLAIDHFIPDDNPPQLVQFVMFDFNTGILVLSFNETIQTSSANFSEVRLQQNFSVGSFLVLQQGRIVNTQEFSTSLFLQLVEDDLNELK